MGVMSHVYENHKAQLNFKNWGIMEHPSQDLLKMNGQTQKILKFKYTHMCLQTEGARG